jgi:hypothetical protein
MKEFHELELVLSIISSLHMEVSLLFVELHTATFYPRNFMLFDSTTWQ